MKVKNFWYLSVLFQIFGCSSFNIVNIDTSDSAGSKPIDYSIKETAGIEKLNIGKNNAYGDAGNWQQGLTGTLRNENIFEKVVYPYHSNDDVDLIVRGTVSGTFRTEGGSNFATWFPGPLIFAQMWRGTQFIYDAQADIEVVDTYTEEVVGQYHVNTSHQLIHRSYNPLHFFGVPLIYGVIKASMTTWPRKKYRQQMYEVAYPDLWKKIASSIAEDQGNHYAARMKLIEERCSGRLDSDPVIGMPWSEFTACQTSHFKQLGERHSASGKVSVYSNRNHSLEIEVAGDRILNWFVPER